MKIGDRVRLNAMGIKRSGLSGTRATRVGRVVGRPWLLTRNDLVLCVMWDGLKMRQPYAVEFLELAE